MHHMMPLAPIGSLTPLTHPAGRVKLIRLAPFGCERPKVCAIIFIQVFVGRVLFFSNVFYGLFHK